MALNKQTLSEQIYQILKKEIITQKISGGSKLTLKSLMEKFEVSSTPIREALTRLIEDDLVVYYSNVGVSVISLSPEEIKDIYDFISDLDSLALEYASSKNNQVEIIKELEHNINALSACDSSSIEWQELSEQFHLIFYKYCGNNNLNCAAARVRCKLTILAYQYEKLEENQLQIFKEHNEIYLQYKNKNYKTAVELMKQHVRHSLDYAIKTI